ncbi:uncharacterized protein LOC143623107 [Bidens hawaiensis]|uniref:uncharacterized protein LOC143623107 n=1 Tax=Bidens hawaiensis TaxID=980011 RepID=UPI00404B436D
MFILKTTVEEEILDHIKDATSPKVAWDMLAEVLSKKNDARLQLLENELLSISQKDLTIAQYFHRVKTLCGEIAEPEQQFVIGDARMKRIIIHGLRAEYKRFVAAVQGWPTQPSLGEFENILASQEALAKKLGGLSISSTSTTKIEDEAVYVERGKGKFKSGYKQKGGNRYGYNNKYREYGGKKTCSSDRGEASCDRKQQYNENKSSFKCYKCGQKGHFARSCHEQQNNEGNAVTVEKEDGWDMEAFVAQTKDVVAFTASAENCLDEWIVDSGASNHLT